MSFATTIAAPILHEPIASESASAAVQPAAVQPAAAYAAEPIEPAVSPSKVHEANSPDAPCPSFTGAICSLPVHILPEDIHFIHSSTPSIATGCCSFGLAVSSSTSAIEALSSAEAASSRMFSFDFTSETFNDVIRTATWYAMYWGCDILPLACLPVYMVPWFDSHTIARLGLLVFSYPLRDSEKRFCIKLRNTDSLHTTRDWLHACIKVDQVTPNYALIAREAEERALAAQALNARREDRAMALFAAAGFFALTAFLHAVKKVL